MREKFEDFLRVEASGWKGVSGSRTAIALHTDLRRFYENVLEGFHALDAVQLNCLEVRGETIAADFCVSDHDTLYLLKTGYDESWSKLSPGALLVEFALKYAVEHPAIKHVNLIADMEWSRSWRPKIMEVKNLVMFNSTPVGKLCRAGMDLKKQWTRFRSRHSLPETARNAA